MNAVWKGLLLGAAMVVGSAAMMGAASAQTELIVTGFGGAYDKALKAGAKSFEEKNGVKISVIPSAGADNLVRVRNKEVDIIVSDPLFSLRLEAEGLFEKLDPNLVPNLAHLHPVAKYSDYTVSANFGAYIIAYSPERTAPPTSWFDLEKPEYAGRVMLRDFRPENIDLIVMFAKLAGGDERNPGAGFAQMAKIGKNVHAWAHSHAEILQMFRNGEIDVGTWTDGRVNWAKTEENVNVAAAVPREGIFPLSSTINVVKGRPHVELAQKFINHMLGPESGVTMAKALGYFPTNMTIELPEDVASKMILNKETIKNLRTADWKYIASVYDEWQKRWEREVKR